MSQTHASRPAAAKRNTNQAVPGPCPCGGQPPGASYADCCARLIERHQAAPDAAALMRSRYTAYVHDNFVYLHNTWDPRTCPPDLAGTTGDEPRPRWLGLTIKRHATIDENHAEVEFVARYKMGGRAQRLHEVSRFTRVDGNWLYVAGDLFD